MTGIVVDGMTAPAAPAQLMAMGVTGFAGYVAPAAWNWPKVMKRPYIDAGLAVPGFGFAFIWEAGISNYQGGAAGGATDGRNWLQGAHDLGLPDDAPAMITYDTSIPPSEFPTAVAYAQGFAAAVLPHPCLSSYAEGALIEALVAAGVHKMGWESESKSFPGNQTPTVHTTMVQIYGQTVPGLAGSYDYNQVLAHDWGQWPRPGVVPPTVEDDMLAYPRLATQGDAWHGRKVALGFDPSTGTLFLSNGGQFVDTVAGFKVTQWPVGNATGVSSTAQLVAAHNGALDFGLDDVHQVAVVQAKGDCGSFTAPFKNVQAVPVPPVPPVGPIDVGAVAAAVAPLLKITT